jgi:hypothetical protein
MSVYNRKIDQVKFEDSIKLVGNVIIGIDLCKRRWLYEFHNFLLHESVNIKSEYESKTRLSGVDETSSATS